MIAKWFIIGMLSLEGLLTVANVGKPREPVTPTLAVATVVICVAAIVVILIWWS